MFLKLKNREDGSDRDLLLQYRKNKDAALVGILYSRYVTLVYGVCLKYLEERETAKDAVMHIFEQLTVELHRHEVLNFRSWLYVFCKNYCLMQLRKEKVLRKREEKWLAGQDHFVEKSVDLHPIDKRDRELLYGAINNCVEKLKEEQQYCIRQFYYENKSYRSIAEEKNWSEKKVKSLLQNGKRNLKICLDQKDVG